MDSADIGPIITALAVLVTAITALISVIRNGNKLNAIHQQTNSTLTTLQSAHDAAVELRATAAELKARTPLP